MSRHQHERMKAKVRERVVEKIDPARQKEAEDLRKIIGTTRTMLFAGILISLLGCLLNVATDSEIILWVLGVPGLILAFIGYGINLRRAKCPGCKGFLGAMPSIARSLPKSCPHCGRKW